VSLLLHAVTTYNAMVYKIDLWTNLLSGAKPCVKFWISCHPEVQESYFWRG
jgi:hypothetical protein